jgi:hypothetical protein
LAELLIDRMFRRHRAMPGGSDAVSGVLRIPVEDDGLPAAPILVEDLRAVLGRHEAHDTVSLLAAIGKVGAAPRRFEAFLALRGSAQFD